MSVAPRCHHHEMASHCRSYRYLLQPTVRQRADLDDLLRGQCELYNAALEERRGAWRWERRSVSYFDQCRTLTELRGVRPDIHGQGVKVCRGTLKRLDLAFSAFYRRCKAGQTPGFPRFKSVRRWNSVQWDEPNGWRLDTDRRRLHVHGIGDIKVRLHRSFRGTPRAIAVAREGRRWWVTVRCVGVPGEPLPRTGRSIGLDLGVCNLVATSDGTLLSDGRYGRSAAERLTVAQQSLSRKRRGSRRRQRAVERVAGAHRKVRNQRKDLAHKLSRGLVDQYDLIVHEDLQIANMVRRPRPKPAGDGSYLPNGAAAKGGLNRSIHDAGWGQLLSFIAYKAEDAGREVITVDPRHTSQRCSRCGHVAAANRVTRATFTCRACGYHAHADINAAVNILRAGRAQRALACAGSNGPTAPDNARVAPER
jgi:putative transposase